MKVYKLKELLKIKNGRDYKHLDSGNIPVYGSGGIMCLVDDYLYDGESILLPRKGTLDNITEVNKETVVPKYLYYYLSLLDLSARDSGSTLPSMTFDSYYSLDIELPDYKTQLKVANLLSKLDEKISINNKINDNLQQLAETIYNYWFVQFNFPDENGKPYKSSGGRMIWNDKLNQEIPLSWSISDISKSVEIIRGVSYSPSDVVNYYSDEYVPLLKSNNIQNDQLILSDIIYIPKKLVNENQYLDSNSIFITMSSGSTEHVGKTVKINYRTPYCYGAFCSKINLIDEFKNLIAMYFTTEYFKRKLRTIVIGTSIKNISNEHLLNNIIAFPDKTTLTKYNKVIEPIFKEQGRIIKENLELKSLRDYLLPLLMNSQITIEQ